MQHTGVIFLIHRVKSNCVAKGHENELLGGKDEHGRVEGAHHLHVIFVSSASR
jgi:hypothetical protein